jgi:5'-deoxynucleotidase YfbR-like HD superfamily hydrolase
MKWLEFAHIIGKLKSLVRTGWTRYDVRDPEDVADHSFRTALLALVLAKEAGVDAEKAVAMALVHDIGEAKIGDIITAHGRRTLPNLGPVPK